ncbi:phosphate transport system regulatory protein PhoU [Tardibacter chloracetimidivorans]|uniref:Phosphate-specific transport system accessory protein PhoU n=1 Tax=Tardibacter chloracetimidivorans TaxID=1921510 RepID=A0A1L3ZRR9_9SPHN|nr:phosphate signaling complex protein PhoU [Tardibacter chloracetimidivorans]API58323.1 phosphate transport system regulatory protein PhoU [Tardibacter chloracetimidivorans]
MATTTGHTVKAFDDDLDELRALISQMGGLAEAAIADAVQALARKDTDLALRVIEGDKKIDQIEVDVERLAVRLIALRAPMADDLREVVAALKTAGVIERIGDYAKNIAKRVAIFAESNPIAPMTIVPEMARVVAQMVKSALDAFVARDAELAARVRERDKTVDDFYNSLFRTLLTYMMENPNNITASAHLLFIAKNLERIGDHATNVAEMVYYSATGVYLDEREKGGDSITPVKAG